MLNYKLLCCYKTIYSELHWICTLPVKQLLPFHPLTHVQVSGDVHCLLVPQGELQIALLRGKNDYNVSTGKCNHTC